MKNWDKFTAVLPVCLALIVGACFWWFSVNFHNKIGLFFGKIFLALLIFLGPIGIISLVIDEYSNDEKKTVYSQLKNSKEWTVLGLFIFVFFLLYKIGDFLWDCFGENAINDSVHNFFNSVIKYSLLCLAVFITFLIFNRNKIK